MFSELKKLLLVKESRKNLNLCSFKFFKPLQFFFINVLVFYACG